MTYRGYRIEPLGTFSMVYIRQPGSGHVPVALSGNFTTYETAKRAIDMSLSELVTGRKKKNAKETSTPSN